MRPGRWVQFGINGDPAIAQAWRSQTLADDPFVQSNTRGTVAFAFAVPNGRTTQVFINTNDNSATHDKEPFTPFGRVIAGMTYVDALPPPNLALVITSNDAHRPLRLRSL